MSDPDFTHARELSPRRSTSTATDVTGLVAEQLAHFSIDPKTEMGGALGRLAEHIYRANIELHHLWKLTTSQLSSLDRRDRIAYFNAKKFLCFRNTKLWRSDRTDTGLDRSGLPPLPDNAEQQFPMSSVDGDAAAVFSPFELAKTRAAPATPAALVMKVSQPSVRLSPFRHLELGPLCPRAVLRDDIGPWE